MAGQRFVDAEPLQRVVVVLAEFGFDAGLGRFGIDGRDPIFSFGLGFERRRAVEAGHRINSAEETGRGDDFQVVAGAEADDFFVADELSDVGELRFDGFLEPVAGSVIVGNLGEDFGDDQVLALMRGELGVVGVRRIHLSVHGQCEVEHFGADGGHFLFGVGEDLLGRHGSFHDKAEFFVVERLAETPAAFGRALGEIEQEPGGKIVERADGGGPDLVIFGGQLRTGGDFRGDGTENQIDVALIFLNGGVDPNRVAIGEVGFHLFQQARNLLDAIENLRDADIVRGVGLGQRKEERIADEFDDGGRVVAVVLNFVEFEKVEADLIVDELPVGGVFGIEGGDGSFGVEAVAPGGVEGALLGDGFEAQIVEQGVEFDFLAGFGIRVNVVAGGGGAYGGEGEGIFHELIAEGGEFLGGGGIGRLRRRRGEQSHEYTQRTAKKL